MAEVDESKRISGKLVKRIELKAVDRGWHYYVQRKGISDILVQILQKSFNRKVARICKVSTQVALFLTA